MLYYDFIQIYKIYVNQLQNVRMDQSFERLKLNKTNWIMMYRCTFYTLKHGQHTWTDGNSITTLHNDLNVNLLSFL